MQFGIGFNPNSGCNNHHNHKECRHLLKMNGNSYNSYYICLNDSNPFIILLLFSFLFLLWSVKYFNICRIHFLGMHFIIPPVSSSRKIVKKISSHFDDLKKKPNVFIKRWRSSNAPFCLCWTKIIDYLCQTVQLPPVWLNMILLHF